MTPVTYKTIMDAVEKVEDQICQKLDKMEAKMDANFVTKSEWEPYKAVINAVGISILLAIIGAVLTLVIRQPEALACAISYIL